MDNFFSNAFKSLTIDQNESFCRTVIMADPSDYAMALRLEYYKTKFKSMGKNVKIGANVKIVNPQFITVGDNVNISDFVTLIARGEGGIVIGNDVNLNDRVYIDTESSDTGYVTIGDSAYIGTGTTLFGHVGLEIGDHVLMAQNITITPYSHIFDDPTRDIITQGGHTKKVVIGRDAYLGMGVCVMYSGSVGDGSVVGAHSTVVKPIPAYSVAVGTPAKVIKKRGSNL
ncbi:MAG: acyltransferase [Clostridia bacterium]|nr:acyltransferase [Clostridia bacterium]